MIVYRVETEDGLGAYRVGSFDDGTRLTQYFLDTYKHPTPLEDSLMAPAWIRLKMTSSG